MSAGREFRTRFWGFLSLRRVPAAQGLCQSRHETKLDAIGELIK
jgi:hypothetical protein